MLKGASCGFESSAQSGWLRVDCRQHDQGETRRENCYHSHNRIQQLSRFLALARGGVLAAGLAAFSLGPTAVAQPIPSVVAANGILCDLVRVVAGADVSVVCVVPDGADPHDYRLTASDRSAINSASLVFVNGYNLSPALDRVGRLKPTVKVAEVAVPSSPRRDPHVWHNPLQSASMATVVSTQLKGLVPAQSGEAISARASRVLSELKRLDQWASSQFDRIPKAHRVIITEHDALSSLAARYQIRYLPLMQSFSSGGPLRPSSLGSIAEAAQSSGTNYLFSEAKNPSKTLRRISKVSGVPIYRSQYLSVDGVAYGGTYVSTFVTNVCAVVTAQGGVCDRVSGDALATQWKALGHSQ